VTRELSALGLAALAVALVADDAAPVFPDEPRATSRGSYVTSLRRSRPIVPFEEAQRREQAAVDSAIARIVGAAEKRARKAAKRLARGRP
jgi:hypothetical protein